jgi:acyl-CoA thioesterase-2
VSSRYPEKQNRCVNDEERWSDAPDMQSVLDLEPLDRDLFRGHNAISARNRRSLYGGQVAAQALRAAGLTVDPDRHAHSLHGYFLRPGRADRPVILHVDRDRDGRSFSARHVRAVQEGEVIFSMLASFHVDEPSATYDAVPTKTPAPPADGVDARGDFIIEMHEITPMQIEGDRILYPDSMWIRLKDPLTDEDRLARACALTYMSDMGSGFGQLRVDGLPSGGASGSTKTSRSTGGCCSSCTRARPVVHAVSTPGACATAVACSGSCARRSCCCVRTRLSTLRRCGR